MAQQHFAIPYAVRPVRAAPAIHARFTPNVSKSLPLPMAPAISRPIMGRQLRIQHA
jgi:hypothetical protein